MFAETNNLFRLAFAAVAALIVTSVVALTVVVTHQDTAMAQGKPWPSKPAAAPAQAGSTAPAKPAPTGAQTSPVAKNSPMGTEQPQSAPTTTPAASTPAVRAPLTYTVKRGDNLTVIADWFKLHGYGDLYERNRKVIGSDPDLIRPGQKITVGSAGMSTSG